MNKISIDRGTLKIEISKEELNLDKTFKCGQAFRWQKYPNGEWVGVVDGQIWVLKQEDNEIYTNIKEPGKERLIEYLDLNRDYTQEIQGIDLTDFERRAYEKAKGIHILKQDLWETIVTFMMSSCNTMRNIEMIVRRLCSTYGDKTIADWNETRTIADWNGVRLYGRSFPSPEKLVDVSPEEFRELSMGFRADYLYDLCQYMLKDPRYLEMLKGCDYKESIKSLKKLNGIGDKVANCIALFSLHYVDAFPIDTHIKKIINEEYGGSIDIKRFNGIAGIIQQYMFYYKAFK